MATGYSDLEVHHRATATGPIPVQEEKIFTHITTEPGNSSHVSDSKLPLERTSHSLCGLRLTRGRIWLLVLLLLVVAGGIAAGVAAGIVVAKNSSSRSLASPGGAVSSLPSSEASSSTAHISSTQPATLITSTEVASPTQTLYRDCPSSNNTIYNGAGSALYQFRKLCARSFKQPPVNVINQQVASLNDCIDLCAAYNISNKTEIASGQSSPCNSVCWRNSAKDPDWPGQCFGSTIFNSTAGFQTRDEVICDSGAWINQDF